MAINISPHSTAVTAPYIGADDKWSFADAAELYGIDNRRQGYFSVNGAGHLAVAPDGDPSRRIGLKQLVDDLRGRDLQPPILIRFNDILKHRVAAGDRVRFIFMGGRRYGVRFIRRSRR